MKREYMPAFLRRKYELAEINYALEHIHFPKDQKELLFARKRLVFDEFFMFLVGVRRLKESREGRKTEFVIRPGEETRQLKESLPYALTAAQERTLQEVFSDLKKGCVMNRLVQGDVGSGKIGYCHTCAACSGRKRISGCSYGAYRSIGKTAF